MSTITSQKGVKEIINSEGLNTSKDLSENLDNKLINLLKDACNRAKANSRSTVMSKDL